VALKKKTVKKKVVKKVKKDTCGCNCNNVDKKLQELKEKITNTSWHHLQSETTIKQFFCELIDVLSCKR